MDDLADDVGCDAEGGIRYEPNEMFRAAAGLAARGMKVVKLYGVRDDGSCTCWQGENCPSAGKHPAMGDGWPSQATDDEDEIASWFEETGKAVRWNIGVRLGRVSGIIDVEADDEQALAVMKQYGLDQIDTLAYRGSRGPHYLFQFDPELPDVGVVHVGALEVRLGGGERAAQSVFPMSWHRTGKQYQWLPGRSPEDAVLAPLPEPFKTAIFAVAGQKNGSGCVRDAREALAGEEFIGPGGRHRYLLGFASDQFFKERQLDEDARRRVLTITRALNETNCRPPKDDSEVVRIIDDQFHFYQRARAEGHHEIRGDAPNAEQRLEELRNPWARAGLRQNDRLWHPGDWRTTCVHSDPRRYRLTVIDPNGDRNVAVNLTAEEWLSPVKVARKILAATGTVNMHDPSPGRWAKTWSGHSEQNEQGQWVSVRGLSAQLLDPAFLSHEYPAPELIRAATVAGLLHSHLMQPRRPTDSKDIKPHESGSAKWVFADGRQELWFVWATVWQEINESAETPVTAAEKQNLDESLRLSLGIAKFRIKQPGGMTRRYRYYRWDDDTLAALARLAGLEGSE